LRIIPQSFKPIIHTDDHVANIAAAARLCYKSEGKALADETPFVRGLVKGQHNSTLEMSVLHLHIAIEKTDTALFYILENNFIVKTPSISGVFCTGSIRAWREFLMSVTFQAFLEQNTMDLCKDIYQHLFDTLNDVFTQDLNMNGSVSPVYKIREFDPTQEIHSNEGNRHIHQGIKFITNRAVTHEFVRHRPCAFLQESQRYCNYSKDQFGDEVTFIDPRPAFGNTFTELYNYSEWYSAMLFTEAIYLGLLEEGAPAQAARTVLPNSCKTELIIYCSLAQWEHIMKMRHSSKADPSMREAIAPVFDWFTANHPKHFTVKENLQRSIG
jgi:thymidylate synthase (FAD)